MSLPWVEAKSFREQVVLIVGAGRGIGAGLVERFAQAGADVIACDAVSERVDALEAALVDEGLHVNALTADITVVAEIEALFAQLRADYGRLDVLVNCAGFNRRVPVAQTDEALWNQTQDVNLKGPYFCAKAAAKIMGERGCGRIVNISSVGGYAAQMHLSAYSAAKGGLTLMTKAMALEFAPLGVTVNAVGPGAVEGPWNDQFFSDPEYRRRWMATSPIKRLGTNDDVAAAVMYFASPDAGYVTGQVLYVDGGKLTYVPSVSVLSEAFDEVDTGEAE